MAKKKSSAGAGKTAAKIKQKREQKAASQPAAEPSIQVMVWYEEEHYQTLKTMFVDGDQLPTTYAEWLQRAEEKKAQGEAEGDQVVKVYIDPETFPQWCEIKNLPMDANSRSQLAIEIVQARSLQL